MAEKLKTIKIERKTKSGGVVSKEYATVDGRVVFFRENYKGWRLNTEFPVLNLDDNKCVCIARVFDPDGNVASTGIAYEWQDKPGSMVNSTSFIENAETSAVGRALGFLGIGIDGTGIASYEEVKMAQEHQDAGDPAPKTKERTFVCGKNIITAKDDGLPAPAPVTYEEFKEFVTSNQPVPATDEQILKIKDLVEPDKWLALAQYFGHKTLSELTYVEARKVINQKTAGIK